MRINHWFTAVVEDIADPLQSGRIRVRCIGYHSSDASDIPTADLPWASVLLPVTSASLGGIGCTPTGVLPGSWVIGFFRDGDEMQDPVVIGVLATGASAPLENGGTFGDPHSVFPLNGLSADSPALNGSGAYGRMQYAAESFNGIQGAQSATCSTLEDPSEPIVVSGDKGKLVSLARAELNIRENKSTNNVGPGIQKYWNATNSPGAYGSAWCAAFCCWLVQQSGILPEANRPKSASCYKASDSWEQWARKQGSAVTLITSPTKVLPGDFVIFSFSHIGLVVTESDANGRFKSIDGNTYGSDGGNGVYEKNRTLSLVRSVVRINTSA